MKVSHRVLAPLFAVLLLAVGVSVASAQALPLFPGAEGFGGTFMGTAPGAGWFSNADVYHVTTLADTGTGSLREGLDQGDSNRIIVFDVAGTIHLGSQLDIKTLENYYIAGQTAPGPVTVYGDMTQITHSNDTDNTNVILRYLTFRADNSSADEPLTFAGGGNDPTKPGRGRHMIVDHASTSWGDDENLSVANLNTDITVQYSIFAEAIGSGHQYGSLIRPRSDADVTFHHNLYANDKSRNPRMGSYNNKTLNFDFVDNVIYNWSDRAGYAGGGSDGGITEKVNLNWVGNYAIAGPATSEGADSTTAVTKDINGSNGLEFNVYQALNLIDSDHDADREATGNDTGWNMFRVSNGTALPEADKASTPFATPPVTTTGAAEAYNQVIDYVGNWWWDRDPIDDRIIGNVQNNTQPDDGIPLTAPVTGEDTAVLAGADPENWIYHPNPAGWDTENNGVDEPPGDGMPTWWELEHGLNPNSIDAAGDFDNDGYINVLEYLNDVGAFPAPAPIVFNGATNSRYAQITNWKTDDGGNTTGSNWQPSRFDEAQINSGTVVVDAVGQHAGTVKIGSNPGDNATLNITGGWLKVEDAGSLKSTGEVIIGADDAATAALNLSGGRLRTEKLSKGAGGTFSFTGGVLSADEVDFDLVNNGGTLAPGSSVGQTHVMGDLTLSSGDLEIELESSSLSDFLQVDGTATLGGNLIVELLDGFSPTNGNWLIMTANDFDGSFNSITSGYSVVEDSGSLFLQLGVPATLVGDYNDDGIVDAADYTVWRDAKEAGAMTLMNRDFGNSGFVDEGDYASWRANFGMTSGSGSGGSGPVPEPSSLILLALSGMVLGIRCQRRLGHRSR